MSQPVAPCQQALLQPSQPITPHQQAMQPPRPEGRGGVAQSASSAAAPTTGQAVQECGRQPTRGQGLLGRSASHPGCGRGLTASAPATNTQGGAPPQPGRRTRTSRYDPAILAGNYRSGGWRTCSRSTTVIISKLHMMSLSGLGSRNFSSTALWPRKPKL